MCPHSPFVFDIQIMFFFLLFPHLFTSSQFKKKKYKPKRQKKNKQRGDESFCHLTFNCFRHNPKNMKTHTRKQPHVEHECRHMFDITYLIFVFFFSFSSSVLCRKPFRWRQYQRKVICKFSKTKNKKKKMFF